ncbi:MAG: thioredoxin domain-containing protein [Fluviicola sp.]|jgi:rhodanese-related sulfurtransferase
MKNTILALLLLLFAAPTITNAQVLDPKAFELAIQTSGIQLLDVRTAGEYESGHIKGALQADWTNKTQFQERVAALDKTRPVYVYCLSGGRSGAAQQWMLNNGFTNVINMQGGMNAWNQAGLPVEGTSKVSQISKKDFMKSIPVDKTVLVDFGAEWCPPCKKMAPIVDELEKAGTTVIKIDGGTQKDLCKEMQIGAFPTFIVYKNGVETWRKTGVVTKEELEAALK